MAPTSVRDGRRWPATLTEVSGPLRRKWNLAQKLAIVRETYESGKSVSAIASSHGLYPSQLYMWRKLHCEEGRILLAAHHTHEPSWMARLPYGEE